MDNIETRAQFDFYYQKNIVPNMIQKETVRKQYLKLWYMLIGANFIFFPLALLLYKNNYQTGWVESLLYIIAMDFLIILLLTLLLAGFYSQKIKSDIILSLIHFFGNWEYGKHIDIEKEVLKNSLIFGKFRDVETGDCFLGSYKEVNIKICEKSFYKYWLGIKSRKNKIETFDGLVLELDMNKKFSSHTVVLKDSRWFNAFKLKSGYQKVALEDVVFEKEFEVLSKDQVEARYLLTPLFMEQILKLKKLYKGKKIELSFKDSKVLIAVKTSANLFEPCYLFKSNTEAQPVYDVFEQFMTIFKIVDILKLYQKNVTL